MKSFLIAFTLSSFSTAALAGSNDTFSTDDSGATLSCSQVDCPYDGFCTIQGTTLSKIGVTNLTTNLTPDPLNWIVGSRFYDRDPDPAKNIKAIEKRFFLGDPKSLNLQQSGLGGCAMFFVDEDIKFSAPDSMTSEGTCGDALGDNCVSALTSQAWQAIQNMTLNHISVGQACQGLRQSFMNQSVVQACSGPNRKNWKNIQVAGFTGKSAPSTIMKDAGTNCMPISPKSNSLRHVWGYNLTNLSSAEPWRQLLNVVPVMTVLFGNGSQTNITAETHLSCIKPTGYSAEELSSMGHKSPGNTANRENTAEQTLISQTTMFVGVLAVVFALL